MSFINGRKSVGEILLYYIYWVLVHTSIAIVGFRKVTTHWNCFFRIVEAEMDKRSENALAYHENTYGDVVFDGVVGLLTLYYLCVIQGVKNCIWNFENELLRFHLEKLTRESNSHFVHPILNWRGQILAVNNLSRENVFGNSKITREDFHNGFAQIGNRSRYSEGMKKLYF